VGLHGVLRCSGALAGVARQAGALVGAGRRGPRVSGGSHSTSVLRIPNLIWFRFGNLLNRIVGPAVTSLMFFLVFTPFALILRMAGKDLLRLRRDPAAASYWIERDPPGPPPASMVEQF